MKMQTSTQHRTWDQYILWELDISMWDHKSKFSCYYTWIKPITCETPKHISFLDSFMKLKLESIIYIKHIFNILVTYTNMLDSQDMINEYPSKYLKQVFTQQSIKS